MGGIFTWPPAEKAQVYLEYRVATNDQLTTAQLFVRNQKSIYYKINPDTMAFENHSKDTGNGVEHRVKMGSSERTIGWVQTDLANQNMLSVQKVFKAGQYTTYHVQENPGPIHWQFTNEQKQIAGFSCRKAITKLKGRAYEAWYTSKIPIGNGPWKLHGLPGAIIKAYSTDGFIHFDLIKVGGEKTFPQFLKIQDSQSISCEQYLKYVQEQGKEIAKKVQSKLPRGATFSVHKATVKTLETECH